MKNIASNRDTNFKLYIDTTKNAPHLKALSIKLIILQPVIIPHIFFFFFFFKIVSFYIRRQGMKCNLCGNYCGQLYEFISFLIYLFT